MKWTKATERLPEPFKVVPCKYTPDSPDPRQDTELHWGFVHKDGHWANQWQHHQVEWLDESDPSPIDESALQREPVQAIMTLIMRLCNDEQKKVIYEKLGRRVEPSPTDESALEKEAKGLYPYPNRNDFEYEIDFATQQIKMDKQRSAYLEGRRKTLSDLQQMGLLLMDKDGEIERLREKLEILKLNTTKFIHYFELAGIEKFDDNITTSGVKKLIESL